MVIQTKNNGASMPTERVIANPDSVMSPVRTQFFCSGFGFSHLEQVSRPVASSVIRPMATVQWSVQNLPPLPIANAATSPCLLLDIGGQRKRTVTADECPVVVGRDTGEPESMSIATDSTDVTVSKRHCEICFDPTRAIFFVKSVSRTNKTRVANADGTSSAPLCENDVSGPLGEGAVIVLGTPPHCIRVCVSFEGCPESHDAV